MKLGMSAHCFSLSRNVVTRLAMAGLLVTAACLPLDLHAQGSAGGGNAGGGNATGGTAGGGTANPPGIGSYNFSFMMDAQYFVAPASYTDRWIGTWKEARDINGSGSCEYKEHAQTRWDLYKTGIGSAAKWTGKAKLLVLPIRTSGSCAALPGYEASYAPRTLGDSVWTVTVKELRISGSNVTVLDTDTDSWFPQPSSSSDYLYFAEKVRDYTSSLNFSVPTFLSSNTAASNAQCRSGSSSSVRYGARAYAFQAETGCNDTTNTDDGRYYTSLSCIPPEGQISHFDVEGTLIRGEKPCACEVTNDGAPSVDTNACSERGTPPSAAECQQTFANANTENFTPLGNNRYHFDVRLAALNQGVSKAMPADFMVAGERSSRLDPASSAHFTSGLNDLHGYLSEYLSADGRNDRLFKAGLLTFNKDGHTHRFLADVPETPLANGWIGELVGACDVSYGNGASKAFSQNLAHSKRACLDSTKARRVLIIAARGQEQLTPTLEATLASVANLSDVTIFALGLDVDHPTADLLRRVVKQRGTQKGAYYNVRNLSGISTALESIATSFLPSGPATNMIVEVPLAPQFTLVSAQLFRRNGQTLEFLKNVQQSQGTGALHFNLDDQLALGQEKVLRVTVEMTQCLNQTVDVFASGTKVASFANACGLHNRALSNPGAGFSPGCLSLSGAARGPDGIAISGALIEARLGAQTVFQTVTDVAGGFLLPALGAGSYTLEASANGLQFAAQFQNPVVLSNQSQANLVFIGMPGSASSSSSAGSQSSAGSSTSGSSSSAGQSSSAQSSSNPSSQASSSAGSNGSGASSSASNASAQSSAAPAPTPIINPISDPEMPTPSCASLELAGLKQGVKPELRLALRRFTRQFNAPATAAIKRQQRRLRGVKRAVARVQATIVALPDRISSSDTPAVRAQKVAAVSQIATDIRGTYDLSLRVLLARNAGINRATDRRGRVRAAFDKAVNSVNETLIPYLTTRCG